MHLSPLLAASQNPLPSLIIFMLIPVAMYFLLIRPQRRRQRETAALQSAIEVGDEIMTTSGVYGFITSFDGDIAWLEIDDNVQIRIARLLERRPGEAPGRSVGAGVLRHVRNLFRETGGWRGWGGAGGSSRSRRSSRISATSREPGEVQVWMGASARCDWGKPGQSGMPGENTRSPCSACNASTWRRC